MRLEDLPLFSVEWHEHLYTMPWPQECPGGYDRALWEAISRCKDDFDRWHGSVDVFDGHWLTGWIKRPDVDASQNVSIYVNDQPLQEGYEARQLRPDVRDAGFAHGEYGYTVPVPFLAYDSPYVKIVIRNGGKVVSFRFFSLTEALVPDLLHAVAAHMARRGLTALSLPVWSALIAEVKDRSAMQQALQAARSCGDARHCQIFAQTIAAYDSQHNVSNCLASLKKHGGNSRPALLEALAQIYTYKVVPANFMEAEAIMAVFVELLNHEDDDILGVLYNNFIANYILSAAPIKPRINFLLERMVIACVDISHMKYFISIIKSFPAYSLDILLLHKSDHDEKIFAEYNLKNYRVRYGSGTLNAYSIGIFDYNYFTNLQEMRRFAGHMRKIFLNHNYDTLNYAPTLGDAAIMQCENLCKGFRNMQAKTLNEANRKNLAAMPSGERFEYAYAGPHHLGGLNPDTDKNIYRRELEAVIGRRLPSGRPLVFCIEDGTTLEGQLKYCLNALARDCTVLLKPYFRIDQRLHARLDKRIIIYNDGGYAPNLPRLAADFVLCSALTSSFLSCLILGVPPLAIFSRYATNRSTKTRQLYPCTQHMSVYRESLINPVWTYLYNHWPFFFDVLKVHDINAAIFQGKYLDWFHANLPTVRQRAFGDYNLANAAGRTAALALRYASDGTFGSDCTAWAAKGGVSCGEGEMPGNGLPEPGFSV